VTKTALLEALWPKTVVGEDALAFQIQSLRRVLGDDAREPRYIATLHRVGYRFIAPITNAVPVVSESPGVGPTFVGRDARLARLREHYAKALRGERQT
jgi:DNA-binding winged helix-turn-helix (wHTH) protein